MIFPLNRMVWGVFPTYLLSSFFRESVRDAHDKDIRIRQQNGGRLMSLLFSCFVLFETGSYHLTLAGLVFTM